MTDEFTHHRRLRGQRLSTAAMTPVLAKLLTKDERSRLYRIDPVRPVGRIRPRLTDIDK